MHDDVRLVRGERRVYYTKDRVKDALELPETGLGLVANEPLIAMPSLHCQAILFDLDGVLLDSVELSERLWCEFAEKHDLDAERILAIHHGRRGVETVSMVAPHLLEVFEHEEREWEAGNDLRGLKAYPGAIALLGQLPDDRWGIVTSGTHRIATTRMAYVGLPQPEVLVTADQVTHGKPHPEPYATGMARIGVHSADCVVFEDASAGVASAKAAGAHVVAIASTTPIEELQAADVVVERLSDVKIAVSAEGLTVSWR
ncbi:MAG: HAD family hydrolase [Rhodothermales bacterium]